jgi:proto-oncogene serine/threonine-protein kinase Pim-3
MLSHLCVTDARELVMLCLSLKPSDRPSLDAILSHPWMRRSDGVSSSSDVDSSDVTMHATSRSDSELSTMSSDSCVSR